MAGVAARVTLDVGAGERAISVESSVVGVGVAAVNLERFAHLTGGSTGRAIRRSLINEGLCAPVIPGVMLLTFSNPMNHKTWGDEKWIQ
jgi:hypothetical protein